MDVRTRPVAVDNPARISGREIAVAAKSTPGVIDQRGDATRPRVRSGTYRSQRLLPHACGRHDGVAVDPRLMESPPMVRRSTSRGLHRATAPIGVRLTSVVRPSARALVARPVVRQRPCETALLESGQPLESILQLGPWTVTAEPDRLDRVRDRGGPPAGLAAAYEEPALRPASGHGMKLDAHRSRCGPRQARGAEAAGGLFSRWLACHAVKLRWPAARTRAPTGQLLQRHASAAAQTLAFCPGAR